MSDILIKGAEELNISIEEKDINSFEIYKEMLKEWNTKINITTITDDEDIDIKHFLDSLTPLVTNLFDGKKNLIDIGTGGGFPGIPLKIIKRELNVTLLDSLNKRINFLNEVINRLELEDIIAIHARAEEMSIKPVYREKYDIAISRAVASLNTLSEYCIPFVKLGGYFISMKGPDAEEELKSGNNAIKVLGGRIVDKKLICIPESDIMHSLIIIEKIKETPTKYPRNAGKPKKNPL